jgi:hypothetical protein
MPNQIKVGSPNSRYIRFSIDVWYNDKNQSIHISAPGADKSFHTTVNENPMSIRYHKNLFSHLRRMLKEHGRWPTDSHIGEEGSHEE